MMHGGITMDVVTPNQARITEVGKAYAVMVLECVPIDIRAQATAR